MMYQNCVKVAGNKCHSYKQIIEKIVEVYVKVTHIFQLLQYWSLNTENSVAAIMTSKVLVA